MVKPWQTRYFENCNTEWLNDWRQSNRNASAHHEDLPWATFQLPQSAQQAPPGRVFEFFGLAVLEFGRKNKTVVGINDQRHPRKVGAGTVGDEPRRIQAIEFNDQIAVSWKSNELRSFGIGQRNGFGRRLGAQDHFLPFEILRPQWVGDDGFLWIERQLIGRSAFEQILLLAGESGELDDFPEIG